MPFLTQPPQVIWHCESLSGWAVAGNRTTNLAISRRPDHSPAHNLTVNNPSLNISQRWFSLGKCCLANTWPVPPGTPPLKEEALGSKQQEGSGEAQSWTVHNVSEFVPTLPHKHLDIIVRRPNISCRGSAHNQTTQALQCQPSLMWLKTRRNISIYLESCFCPPDERDAIYFLLLAHICCPVGAGI